MTRLLLLAVAVATSRAQNLAADKQGNLVASVEGRLEEPGITILRLTITALLPNHGLLGDLLKLLEYMWRCSFIHLFIAMPVYMRPMRHRSERHTPQLPLLYHLLLAYINPPLQTYANHLRTNQFALYNVVDHKGIETIRTSMPMLGRLW